MKKIQKFAKYLRDMIFRRLEAPRRNYEKTMINNMDNLYRVIRKGDIILVEGSSEISRMIKLLTQSSWSHSAIYVGDELLLNGDAPRESTDDGLHRPGFHLHLGDVCEECLQIGCEAEG